MDIRDEVCSRTYGIYGPDVAKLFDAHVAVVGLGGVGGALALSLARAGIGHLTLIDGDIVAPSNLNRQAIASRSVLGQKKADVSATLVADIHPEIEVRAICDFICAENMADFLEGVDYVADCIDDVRAKLDLIEYCTKHKIAIISSMGAGNKRNPCGFRVSDISRTQMDPLARVIRQGLRKRGITHLQVVYSEEAPIHAYAPDWEEACQNDDPSITGKYTKRNPPASSPFVPSAAGLLMGSAIVEDLTH